MRERIPIYVASLGPKNVEMTAELAEGWLPAALLAGAGGGDLGRVPRGGLARSARPTCPPLEIVAGGLLAIGDDVEHLREQARPMLALYFGGMGAKGTQLLQRRPPPATATSRRPTRSRTLYLGGRTKEAAAMVPAGAHRRDVAWSATRRYVKDRLAAYREAGVTVLNVQPVGPNGLADIETLAGWLS